ncbi:hypothetical protein B0H13DRAFT_1609189, partial [Mycena leptocephala]
SLVNPDSEKDIIDDSTEQDIYNVVVASRDAQQMGEINGGDDDVEDNMDFQPRPTRREALSAAQTLRNYTKTLDDGFARKLEQLLASFRRQTQLEETNALVMVPITQWFTRTA